MFNRSVYWWRNQPPWGDGTPVPNFGDELTPLLLEHFSNVQAVWAPPEHADMVCFGSILEHLPAGWKGTVLGTGCLLPQSKVNLAAAKVLAVRGPLTLQAVAGAPTSGVALGDPGLLADELVTTTERKHPMGIVPHWTDKTLASDPRFQVEGRVIIDVLSDPLDVVRTIGECQVIVSSSLHGIVLADAFGIPRRIEYTPSFDRDGGMFKFRDHCSVVGVPFRIGVRQLASRFAVEDAKSALYHAFTMVA